MLLALVKILIILFDFTTFVCFNIHSAHKTQKIVTLLVHNLNLEHHNWYKFNCFYCYVFHPYVRVDCPFQALIKIEFGFSRFMAFLYYFSSGTFEKVHEQLCLIAKKQL